MTTPASDRAEEFLRRIFPEGAPDDAGMGEAHVGGTVHDGGEVDDRQVRGVDERRQRLLEPIGDPDRESW